MSVKPDDSNDEEGNHGLEVTVVETNRFGFILGNGETDRSVLMSVHHSSEFGWNPIYVFVTVFVCCKP